MKLAPLLAQYLGTFKRLDLQGIGTFSLPDAPDTAAGQPKHDKQVSMENVSFESKTSIKESPDLVQFIAAQTGKIKALASADLESHLALARQFLNIGNPFLFEGIGILEKIKSGEYVLIPGTGMQEKIKEHTFHENPDPSSSEVSSGDYKKIFYAGKVNMKWHKPYISILIIAGLALAVWGGYTVYKKTIAKNTSVAEDKNKKEETVPGNDTVLSQKDSAVVPVQHTPSGMQKFILEVCNAKRAYERFGKLKSYQWNVQLETKDSVTYKLFLILPASPGDTSNIIDSLTRLNGKPVHIEK